MNLKRVAAAAGTAVLAVSLVVVPAFADADADTKITSSGNTASIALSGKQESTFTVSVPASVDLTFANGKMSNATATLKVQGDIGTDQQLVIAHNATDGEMTLARKGSTNETVSVTVSEGKTYESADIESEQTLDITFAQKEGSATVKAGTYEGNVTITVTLVDKTQG